MCIRDSHEFVAWAVESYGRTTPTVLAFLRRQAELLASGDQGSYVTPSSAQLERTAATANAIYCGWRRLHSVATARAQAWLLRTALDRCVRGESHSRLQLQPPGDGSEDLDVSSSFANLGRSAAARDCFSMRQDRFSASG